MTAAVLPSLSALTLDEKPSEPKFGASAYSYSLRDPSRPFVPITSKEEIEKAINDTPYEPSTSLWENNQKNYFKPAEDPLPEGFPALAEGPFVWDGKKLINEPSKWLHRFTDAEIADINNAIKSFQSLKLKFDEITRETFPLTILKPVLAKAVQDIHYGVGLSVLRGLPVNSWTREEQIIAFAGISSYIGNTRLSQGGSSAIVHLRDITHIDAKDRPAIVVKGQTNGNQVFHTDAGDIVGLITLDKAAKGGLSQLSSIGQTYNYFSENRRDILRTLAAKWYPRHDLEGNPIIFNVNNRIIAQYGRRPFFTFFEDKERPAGQPELTKEQHAALDGVHFTAEKYSLDIDLEPGDLEFFNNLTVFHARTSSEDDEHHSRHLVRIWIRNEEHALDHGAALEKRWTPLYPKSDITQEWPLSHLEKTERNA